jgi:hypothetical protein
MDMATILPYLLQAVGGAVGGNILGALTRGGGGIVGRTIIGAVGGVGLAQGADHVAAISNITAMWANLAGDNSANLANLITGAAGGGVLGLIAGLLIRPRN